jgi:hypothetical protein
LRGDQALERPENERQGVAWSPPLHGALQQGPILGIISEDCVNISVY